MNITVNDSEIINKLLIGPKEAARVCNVTERQVRYWEKLGFVSSERDGNGERRFGGDNLRKLAALAILINNGKSLKDAVGLLGLFPVKGAN